MRAKMNLKKVKENEEEERRKKRQKMNDQGGGEGVGLYRPGWGGRALQRRMMMMKGLGSTEEEDGIRGVKVRST